MIRVNHGLPVDAFTAVLNLELGHTADVDIIEGLESQSSKLNHTTKINLKIQRTWVCLTVWYKHHNYKRRTNWRDPFIDICPTLEHITRILFREKKEIYIHSCYCYCYFYVSFHSVMKNRAKSYIRGNTLVLIYLHIFSLEVGGAAIRRHPAGCRI